MGREPVIDNNSPSRDDMCSSHIIWSRFIPLPFCYKPNTNNVCIHHLKLSKDLSLYHQKEVSKKYFSSRHMIELTTNFHMCIKSQQFVTYP